MSEIQGRPTGLVRLIVVYSAALLGGIVVLMALVWIMDSYFNVDFQSPAMGVVLVMVAGSSVGQYWSNRERSKPANGRVWLVALLCSLVTIGMQIGLFMLMVDVLGEEAAWIWNQMLAEKPENLAIIFLSVLVLFMLVVRLGLWLGVRSTIKKQERDNGKAVG